MKSDLISVCTLPYGGSTEFEYQVVVHGLILQEGAECSCLKSDVTVYIAGVRVGIPKP